MAARRLADVFKTNRFCPGNNPAKQSANLRVQTGEDTAVIEERLSLVRQFGTVTQAYSTAVQEGLEHFFSTICEGTPTSNEGLMAWKHKLTTRRTVYSTISG